MNREEEWERIKGTTEEGRIKERERRGNERMRGGETMKGVEERRGGTRRRKGNKGGGFGVRK